MRLARAVDRWLGEVARGGRAPSTRFSYQRYLFTFVDQVERSRPDADVREVGVDDCRAFLDTWIERSRSTMASIYSALNVLFSWLYLMTQVYQRAVNRSRLMEDVRDLSWGPGFQSNREKAHTGFEPVPPP